MTTIRVFVRPTDLTPFSKYGIGQYYVIEVQGDLEHAGASCSHSGLYERNLSGYEVVGTHAIVNSLYLSAGGDHIKSSMGVHHLTEKLESQGYERIWSGSIDGGVFPFLQGFLPRELLLRECVNGAFALFQSDDMRLTAMGDSELLLGVANSCEQIRDLIHEIIEERGDIDGEINGDGVDEST